MVTSSSSTGRFGILTVLAVASVAASFTLGFRSADDVKTFQSIQAGSSNLPGDFNSDGLVNVQDAILGLEMSQGFTNTTPEAFKADPNKDGSITVSDVLTVLKQL